MSKLVISIIVGILLLVGGWYLFINGDEGGTEQTAVELTEPQDFPARAGEGGETAEPEEFTSEFSNLAFSYPGNWGIAEGADNARDTQLYTVESPLDINEFYFCLDLYAVDSTVKESFESTGIEVLSVEPIQDGLSSVIYKLDNAEPLYWNVTEDSPEVGDDTFTREISAQNGDRLQVFGRFNCRETTSTELTLEEFTASRWLDEAKAIVNSLTL